MLKSGENLGHYKVDSAIGAGGMGEIYRARDTRLGRDVAIKVLPENLTLNHSAVERFMREARAASALNHPNILTIYDIGTVEQIQFIAAEFVDGQTLRERLQSDEPLATSEFLDIAIQVSGALAAAHSAGIVHRDIKPENIMLRRDGYVKILDFGIAKLTEREPLKTTDADAATLIQTATQPGMIIGTVAYMSPEQARGRAVDARSDIFSFGVVLYEMLAGFNPFKGETTADVLAAVLQREPQPLFALKPDVPQELSRIVAKTLRKDRDERYESCAELLGDLKQFQQQLTAGAFASLSQSSIAQFRETTNSLAILPLACGNSEQTEYLSDGISESIINALAQISGLSVTPRNTVFRFKGSDEERDAQTIGRQLNVRHVLTGRVRQFGENLIIGVELVDVAQDAQIWGEQYRRPITDIFDLQEEIASDISEKLKLKLTGEEKKRLAKRYTENAEAYQFYLKGRYFVTTKRTEEWIKKGIEYFQQAIELDPTYALAFSGLADAYGFLASSTGGWTPRDAYPKAKAAAERALAIDETLGEAHAALGFFHLFYDWNFPAAEREFARAIELSPNYPNAYDGYGFYLKAMGRHAEAIRECQKMQKLDPLSPFAHVSLGWGYYFARRYDEAIDECKKALEMEQDSTFAYRILGFACLQQGKFDDALSALRKAVIFSNNGLAFEAHLGYAYALAGKKTEALQILSNLETIARDKNRYVSSYYSAVIYLGLGEIDKAFERLEKAFEERSGFLPFLNVEPMLDSFRSDSRFEDLLRRIGLPTDEASEAQTAMLSPAATDDAAVPPDVRKVSDFPLRDSKLTSGYAAGVEAQPQEISESSLSERHSLSAHRAAQPQEQSELSRKTFSDQLKNRKPLFILGAIIFLLAAVGFGYWFFGNRNAKQIEPIAAEPPKSAPKLYWQMTEAGQLAFIQERTRHIQKLIGDEPAELDEEALRAIKVEIDDYVEDKDSLSQKPFEEGLRVIYGRATQYAPLVIRAYETRQVPPALGLYQAMVESEYHDCPTHPHPTGPVGLFQFNRKTAASYGLMPEDFCNLEKQSDAAARHMSDLISDFGEGKSSWTLALFSFNQGGNKAREYLRQLRGRGITERSFWAILRDQQNLQPPLTNEGKEYVPRFFAAAVIGETPEAFELSTPPLTTLRDDVSSRNY